MKNVYHIKWGNDFNDNYNYGATISFDEEGVISYSSPLMPPGIGIKTWYSKTVYHVSRKSPMLPLLTPGKKYELYLQAKFDNPDAIQLVIVFFDKDGFFVEKSIIDDDHGEFIFPEMATDYQIQLVNKKHKEIIFKELIVFEAGTLEIHEIESLSNEMYFTREKESNPKSRVLNIYLGQINRNVITIPLNIFDDNLFVFPNKTIGTYESLLMKILDQIFVKASKQTVINISKGKNFQGLLDTQYQSILPVLRRLFSLTEMSDTLTQTNLKSLKEQNELNRKAIEALQMYYQKKRTGELA